MSGRTYITIERNGKKQAVPVKNRKHRKPYGVERPIALEEVQQLRTKGEKARLVETNPNHKLYAAYEGVTGKNVNAIVNSNKQPDNEAITMPQKLPFNKRVPEETIELFDEGERPFIAEIIGPDKNYHYKRKFISQMRTLEGGSRKHPIYKVHFKGKLPYGAIVETKDYAYVVVPKSTRFPHGLREIGTEGMENRLRMNQLFEARDRTEYHKKIKPEEKQTINS